MPASVFHAVVHRLVQDFVEFLNWKSIHIRTDSQCRTANGSFENSYHASFGDTLVNLKPQPGQEASHSFSGAKFTIAEFRVAMEITANLDELGLDFFDS